MLKGLALLLAAATAARAATAKEVKKRIVGYQGMNGKIKRVEVKRITIRYSLKKERRRSHKRRNGEERAGSSGRLVF